MRSRYSAYALGLHSYIMDTTDADGPLFESSRPQWLAELTAFTQDTQFLGLNVIEHVPDEAESTVDFSAKIEQRGTVSMMREKSRFTLKDGVWRYHSAAP
jgi:SEC-C motif-containing protein